MINNTEPKTVDDYNQMLNIYKLRGMGGLEAHGYSGLAILLFDLWLTGKGGEEWMKKH